MVKDKSGAANSGKALLSFKNKRKGQNNVSGDSWLSYYVRRYRVLANYIIYNRPYRFFRK